VPGADTSAPGVWPTVNEARSRDVRLYGPARDMIEPHSALRRTDASSMGMPLLQGGNRIANNLEPESGAFTVDGNHVLVSMQENNAYMVFDVRARQFVAFHGYAQREPNPHSPAPARAQPADKEIATPEMDTPRLAAGTGTRA
jgi:hypothetical protein